MIDDLKKQIASLSSEFFKKELNEKNVSSRTLLIKGKGRYYEAFVIDELFEEDLISSGRCISYTISYETLFKKIKERLGRRA